MAEQNPTFEVLLPVRNPTDVLRRSVESLAAQTSKNFSVLISDNFSTSGHEHIEHALAVLAQAGVPARRIQPPQELGRVEHWNWIHYQSPATWFKPLFAGDWVDDDYVALVQEVARKEPRCAYVYCNYQFHKGGETQQGPSPWRIDKFFTPAEMQDIVLRCGMQFGPPSSAAYRRDVFMRSGGYDPSLPICADSLFFCKLAARHGGHGVSRACIHFLIHAARFSDKLPTKQKETFRESMRYFIDLGVTAWQENWHFPRMGYLRLVAREYRQRRKAQ